MFSGQSIRTRAAATVLAAAVLLAPVTYAAVRPPRLNYTTTTLPNGLTLSVTGWHTGTLGKLVFFVGLATVILEGLRAAGILLPAAVPDRLLLIALGALAVIFVLIRLISVPDIYFVSAGRGIGLYISLLGALGLLGAGLLRTAEELP